ncbi:hypothetical protein lbkm_3642 [Lachnospiraceae bacterium KM106-2]|nr:hypothetical protein lbkm_3642 [Lachnospiraceae bacterium KM106-2]
MNIKVIRSDVIYKKMMQEEESDKKENIYREELMMPFSFKWQCIGVPIKAAKEGGYDVISFNTMGGGYHPSQIDLTKKAEVEQISSESFWKDCENSISRSLERFESIGIQLPVQEYCFTVLLNDPNNPMSKMTGDYCGEGGIPGYLLGTIIPNNRSLSLLPVALAHETNHNVRWQFQKWNDKITLADMIVSEGIAEQFAASLYGEDKVGMWVRQTDQETLQSVIKPLIRANLKENDFNMLSSYLYGDEIMTLRGGRPIGMPYCGGYACGYDLIGYYLENTGKSIEEVTLMKTDEILNEVKEYWN